MFITRYVENQKRQIQKEKNKELAKNIMTGVALGALAGVLLAPQSGEETRNDIKDKSLELGNDLKEGIENKKDSIEGWKNTFSQIKSDIHDRINEGKTEDEDIIYHDSIIVEEVN